MGCCCCRHLVVPQKARDMKKGKKEKEKSEGEEEGPRARGGRGAAAGSTAPPVPHHQKCGRWCKKADVGWCWCECRSHVRSADR